MNVDRRVGVWLVGGRGSVATTALTGAAAVAAGLAEPTGLVTMRPPFADAGCPRSVTSSSAGTTSWRRRWRCAPRVWSTTACCRSACPTRSAARSRPPSPSSGPASPAARRAPEPRPALARIVIDLNVVPHPPRPAARGRRQRLLDRGAGRAASRARGPSAADGRAGSRSGRPPAERAVRAGGDRDRRRVRGLHAVRRRAPARHRGAGRGARGAAGRLGRQDGRDVHEVGAGAGARRAQPEGALVGRA